MLRMRTQRKGASSGYYVIVKFLLMSDTEVPHQALDQKCQTLVTLGSWTDRDEPEHIHRRRRASSFTVKPSRTLETGRIEVERHDCDLKHEPSLEEETTSMETG